MSAACQISNTKVEFMELQGMGVPIHTLQNNHRIIFSLHYVP